ALAKETDTNAQQELIQELSAVAKQLDPAKATQVCFPLIEKLVSAAEGEKDSGAQKGLVLGATNLIQAVDAKTAASSSLGLARSFCSGSLHFAATNTSYGFVGVDPALLSIAARVEVGRRAAAPATAVGLSIHGPFASPAPLRAASDPLPYLLTDQDLVELLK